MSKITADGDVANKELQNGAHSGDPIEIPSGGVQFEYPIGDATSEDWQEWYKKAWTRRQAYEKYCQNPAMSNREFGEILSMLFRPDDLGMKAVAIKAYEEWRDWDEEIRNFYVRWLQSES